MAPSAPPPFTLSALISFLSFSSAMVVPEDVSCHREMPLKESQPAASPSKEHTEEQLKLRSSSAVTSYRDSKKKNQWWQKTSSFVQADLEAVLLKSPFLQQQKPIPATVAYFDRSEIIVAQSATGTGAFSVVYEIIGFSLNPDITRHLTPEQQALRQDYADHCLCPETGRGRFVIKHLKPELLYRKTDFAMAASDLALEAEYLSRMQHDHIITLRGLPVTGLSALETQNHDGYFLIMDRLQLTLDQQIKKWQQQQQQSCTTASNHRNESSSQQQQERLDLLRTKTEYAWQLASAVAYLHEQGILFRDLKPNNVGVNAQGRLQLFDFGLCRELPKQVPQAGDTDDEAVFTMSGAGTRRYMAPEIVNNATYNCKADVYSWAMVTYQMFQLEKPYPTYSLKDHRLAVCQQGERPPALKAQHAGEVACMAAINALLKATWCESVVQRLNMATVRERLTAALRDDGTQLFTLVRPKQTTPAVAFEQQPVSLSPFSPTSVVTATETMVGIEVCISVIEDDDDDDDVDNNVDDDDEVSAPASPPRQLEQQQQQISRASCFVIVPYFDEKTVSTRWDDEDMNNMSVKPAIHESNLLVLPRLDTAKTIDTTEASTDEDDRLMLTASTLCSDEASSIPMCVPLQYSAMPPEPPQMAASSPLRVSPPAA